MGYSALRRRRFVRFFSNRILFAGDADETWLDKSCAEACEPLKEHPVFAFNAGVVASRGLGHELVSLSQPVLLLEGAADGRSKRRDAYLRNMRDCDRLVIPDTLNVLPWEAPEDTALAIRDFAYYEQRALHAKGG